MSKCTICKKSIKPTGKPGRPASTHSKCKKKKSGTTKRTKKGSVRRHGSGTTTRSQKGYQFSGKGTGWVNFWHGGRTKGTQHDKIWSVKVVKKGGDRCAVVTRHGRRTGQKNESTRATTSCRAAFRTLMSLIRSKERKGYVQIVRLRRRGKRGKRRA